MDQYWVDVANGKIVKVAYLWYYVKITELNYYNIILTKRLSNNNGRVINVKKEKKTSECK